MGAFSTTASLPGSGSLTAPTRKPIIAGVSTSLPGNGNLTATTTEAVPGITVALTGTGTLGARGVGFLTTPPAQIISPVQNSLEFRVTKYSNSNMVANYDEVLNGFVDGSWIDEVNGPGSGYITLPTQHPKLLADPTLMSQRNWVSVFRNGAIIGRFVLQTKELILANQNSNGDLADSLWTLSGEGMRTLFHDAVVFPESGKIDKTTGDTRYFNFGSVNKSKWYVSSQWVTPSVGPKFLAANSYFGKEPAGYPIPNGYWIWASGRNSSTGAASIGYCYFRGEFTTSATNQTYSFYAAGDDGMNLFLDGVPIAATAIHQLSFANVTAVEGIALDPGSHVLSAQVYNAQGRAGFIACVRQDANDTNNTPVSTITYTGDAGHWTVCPYPPAEPGWTPGEVMLQLLSEAQTRGVKFPQQMTTTFTASADSAGVPWPSTGSYSFGTNTDYFDVITALENDGVDAYVDPTNLHFNIYNQQGTDYSGGEGKISTVRYASLAPGSTGADMQCVVRVGSTGRYFVTQPHTEPDGVTQSTRVCRLDRSGTLIDQMVLNGAGHGTSIAVQVISGVEWVYVTWSKPTLPPATTDDNIVAFPWPTGVGTAGTRFNRSAVPGLITVLPGGGSYRNVQFDLLNNLAVVRTSGNTSDVYTQHTLANFLAGNIGSPLHTVTLTQSANFGLDGNLTMQGFCSYQGSLFRYTGAPSTTGGGDSPRLTQYSWATGAVTATYDCSNLDTGYIHEPEGSTLFDVDGSNPTILLGMVTGPAGAHGFDVFSLPLNSHVNYANPPTLYLGRDIVAADEVSVAALKNGILAQTADGYVFKTDQNSINAFGRIEGGAQTSVTTANSGTILNKTLSLLSTPNVSTTYKIIDNSRITPGSDFRLGDWIMAPSMVDPPNSLAARRVMSITYSVDSQNSNPNILYAIELDTIYQDKITNLTQLIAKLSSTDAVTGAATSQAIPTTSVGAPVSAGSPSTSTTTNNPPTTFAVGTITGTYDNNGNPTCALALSWVAPVDAEGNNQGVSYYEVYGSTSTIPWGLLARVDGTLLTSTVNVTPVMSWTLGIRAHPSWNAALASDFSNQVTVTSVKPGTALDKPTTPTLTSDLGTVSIHWDGQLTNGSPYTPPVQFKYVSAYIYTNSPSQSDIHQVSGLLPSSGTLVVTGLTVGTTYYAVLYANDTAGLTSAQSGIASIACVGVSQLNTDAAFQAAMTSITNTANAASAAAAAATTAANTAQTTANGKNTVYYAGTAPTGGTYTVNDIWFNTSSGNAISYWSGSAWTSQPLGTGAFASGSVTSTILAAAVNTAITTAQSTANGKNAVFYASTAPTGGVYAVNDIWFNTASGNAISTWNGSSWVAESLGTGAFASGSVTSTVLASAVNTSITTAQSTANTAQTTANGKNTVTYSASAASGSGTVAGDIWYQSSGGIVSAQWIWNGSSWVSQALSNAVISSLDAGKITTGSLASARIAAGTITANQLLVTVGGNNTTTNSTMAVDLTGWGIVANVTGATPALARVTGSGSPVSDTALQWTMAAASSAVWNLFTGPTSAAQVVSGNVYTASFYAKLISGDGGWSLTFANSGGTDAPLGSGRTFTVTGTWTRFIFTFTATGAGSSDSGWYISRNTVTAAGVSQFTGFQFEAGDVATAYKPQVGEILPGTILASMIAANTITAGQIAANTITASQIAANTITAGQIAANTITASQIAAGTITAGQIFSNTITASQIAANTITAAQIAAGTITATQIASSTITASQIAAGTITASQIAAGTITSASGVIANLDAGAITTGTLSSSRIAAGTIVASQLAIADFSNVASGSDFEITASIPWGATASWSSSTTQAHSGTTSWRCAGSGTHAASTLNAPVQTATGEQWYIEYWAFRDASWNGTTASKLQIANQASTVLVSLDFAAASLTASTWTLRSTSVTIAAPTTSLVITLQTDGSAGNVYLDDIIIRRKNAGTLVVDGTITANSLASGSVTTAKLAAGAVTASTIATSTITANNLAVGAITADKIDLGTKPTDSGFNRIPNPLSNQAYWALVIAAGTFNLGGSVGATAGSTGISLLPTVSVDAYCYVALRGPVPASGSIYVSMTSSQNKAVPVVTWYTSGGTPTDVSLTASLAGVRYAFPATAVTYSVKIFDVHVASPVTDIVTFISVFEMIGANNGTTASSVELSPDGLFLYTGENQNPVLSLSASSNDILTMTTAAGDQVATIDVLGNGAFSEVTADYDFDVAGSVLLGPSTNNLANSIANGGVYDWGIAAPGDGTGIGTLDIPGRSLTYGATWATQNNVAISTNYYAICSDVFMVEDGRMVMLQMQNGGLQTSNSSGVNVYLELQLCLTPMPAANGGTGAVRIARSVAYNGGKNNYVEAPTFWRTSASAVSIDTTNFILPANVPIYWQYNSDAGSVPSGFSLVEFGNTRQFVVIDLGSSAIMAQSGFATATDGRTAGSQTVSGGGTGTVTSTTKTFTAQWSASYNNSGGSKVTGTGQWTNAKALYQGNGASPMGAQWGFSSTDLANIHGKTITSASIYLKNAYMAYSGSGVARIGTHNASAATSTIGNAYGGNEWNVTWSSGSSKWLNLSSTIMSGLSANTIKGFQVGVDGSNTDYMYFQGVGYGSYPPQLKVTYH